MKPIEEEWKRYEEKVLPGNAGPVQRTESRRAFFGGALAMLRFVETVVGDGESSELSLAEIEFGRDLEAEIRAYHEELEAEVLRQGRMGHG